MIKRVRDKLRTFKPQEIISYEDWKDIEARFLVASEFLREDNAASQILRQELAQAEEIVLTNRVHEVREVRIIGEIQKIFTTSRDEQMNELVGQIKFIRGYLAELQTWVDRKLSLESFESQGRVIIRRTPEEERLNERPGA